MRHAILGAGGVGGLLAGALARRGASVLLLMRPATLEQYGGRLVVESRALGDFEVDVPAARCLDREVDVLWVTTKATQLEAALELAPAESVGSATVVPLLNGVDHLALLRSRYRKVVAATMGVESERLGPGRIRETTRFIRVDLVGERALAEEVREAGIDCRLADDELTLLWQKLVFLAPVALATTAFDTSLGGIRSDAQYRACRNEALAVARAEGARVDADAIAALERSIRDSMQSSMQRDVAAGRAPELDAIAGPIIRGGRRHGIAVDATAALARLVADRLS